MRFFNSLTSKTKVIHVVRFILVGVLNTGFSYLIYAGFLSIGLGYQLANFLSLAIGILFSFKTQGSFVFGNPDNRRLGRFVLSWAMIYSCNIAIISWIMTFGFDAYAAGALALPVIVAFSYLTQTYFVFHRSGDNK